MANLVGGDINSLYGLADNLQPCAGKVDTVVDSLNTSVKKISDGAGWSGDAATVFEEHWEVGSVAAALVGAFCKATWQAVHDLADNLSTVEADLRAAADEARRNGVAVGPDGTPPEVYGPVNPSSPAATYTYLWQQYRSTAEGFRLQAERTLLEIAHQIEGVVDGTGSGDGLSNADRVTLAAYLRGIAGLPAATPRYADHLVSNPHTP